MIRLASILIVISFSVIDIKECCGQISTVSSLKPCAIDARTYQDDGDDLRNLRSALKSFLKDLLKENIDDVPMKNLPKSAIDECKTLNKVDDDLLIPKFQNVEDALTKLERELKKPSDSVIYLGEKNSLGVHCSSCKKSSNNRTTYPKNCLEVQKDGHKKSGIYEIYPIQAQAPFPVLCDMETDGGGWTHIQKRFDGSQDFYLEWRDYKFGFGDLEGEFWLGLHNIYLLTAFGQVELLIEIVDRDGISATAKYQTFKIGPEKDGYKLEALSGFSGGAGDSLTYSLGQKFSTKDLDFTDGCATKYVGAWWYKSCHISNLNGKFINVDIPTKYNYQGLHWKTFRNHEYCHSKSRMLIRPLY